MAMGILAAAGMAGATTATELYAQKPEVLELPESSDTVSELTDNGYIVNEEGTSQTDQDTSGKTDDSLETGGQPSAPAENETAGESDSREPDVAEKEETGQQGTQVIADQLTVTQTAATYTAAASTYTAAAPQAAEQLQGKGVENAAVNQNQLSADYVLIHGTTGESGQDKYLKSNAQTVLNAKKLLGIYHNGGNGAAVKEAENFYLSTKDYIGKAVFILNANGSIGQGGTAWIRDFLDWFHQFSGVKAVCYETGHNPQGYDWNLVKPAYEVWSDQGAVSSAGFSGTVSAGTYQGNVADWNRKAKADKKQEYSVDMYRLYNKFSSEHLYTASQLEKDVLSKNGAWNYEGIAWRNPLAGGNNVYRLYNAYNGEHHYTTSTLERDSLRRAGWNYEGVGWLTDPSKATAVYRLYNPNLPSGYHLFTTSSYEYNALTKMGWKQEGIAWYASKYFSTVKESHYLKGEYAYDERGRQSTGVQKVGNEFYYANPGNGAKIEKREGIYKVTGGTVYVTGSGKLHKGQKQVEGNWKWFRPETAYMAVSSFVDIPAAYNGSGAKTCYYDNNGNMVKGTVVINGIQYRFDESSGALIRDIGKLQRDILAYINQNKTSGEVWSVALNILDGTGTFFINNLSQQSASSIKLFVMGAVYESYETLCNRYGTSSINSNLYNMIVYSDNNAWVYLVECLAGNGDYGTGCRALSNWCQTKGYMNTYSTGGYGENYTSVKDTMNVVTDMYNGKLRFSQNMLELLKKQTRTWKIPSGIPSGVVTGNKTGELSDTENDTAIVYSRGGAYVLSIMSTALTSVYRAQNMIRQISSMVYRAINV